MSTAIKTPERAKKKSDAASEVQNEALPLLKWAGGKGRLLAQYAPYFPSGFNSYFEPFVGGGAVFFEMLRRGLEPTRQRVRLSDVNDELINLYRTVQNDPTHLIESLAVLAQNHSQEHFYEVRARNPQELTDLGRAARLIYLNRTCFNGLYRVNSKGLFNVPFGRYKNPTIVQEPRLWAVHRALQDVEIEEAPYSSVLREAKKGDLVYFDPPYDPLSASSSFTSYARSSFGVEQQRELAEVFGELDRSGVLVMLSNSDTPLIKELYKNFVIKPMQAPRAINSKADRRTAITELLVLGKTAAAFLAKPARKAKTRGVKS